MHGIHVAYCYRRSGGGLSSCICLMVTKTAEPFEMLFGGRLLWAQAAMCQITVTVNFPCAAPSGLFQITSTTCISYVLTFLVSQ